MKRSPLVIKPPVDRSGEPGYRAWHQRQFGRCRCCGKPGLLVRHHCVLEQHIRAIGGDPWDLRNGLLLGAGYSCRCHRDHHAACRRLPASKLPPEAIEFAIELLGAEQADAYIETYYSPR